MPYGTGRKRGVYRKRRMYRKRRTSYRKRYTSRRMVSTVNKTLTAGFPREYMTKLRYVDNFTLDPSTGTIAQYVFRANDIFDPNYTSIGHQPMGRDVLASIYQTYQVVGSKITVRFLPSYTGSVPTTSLVGVRLSATDSSSSVSATEIMEQGNGRFKVINSRAGNSGNACATIVEKFSGKRWFGWKDARDNLAQFAAPVGSNPAEKAYFICFAGDIGSASDLPIFYCVVDIEYIVRFTEPIEQTQS